MRDTCRDGRPLLRKCRFVVLVLWSSDREGFVGVVIFGDAIDEHPGAGGGGAQTERDLLGSSSLGTPLMSILVLEVVELRLRGICLGRRLWGRH